MFFIIWGILFGNEDHDTWNINANSILLNESSKKLKQIPPSNSGLHKTMKDRFSLPNMLSKARQNSGRQTNSAGCHYRKYFNHVSTWWAWNNKGKSFLQMKHFSVDATARASKDCVVCLVQSCVCLQIICTANIKKFNSLERLSAWETNTQHQRRRKILPTEWCYTEAFTVCVSQRRLYHPSRHILLSPCES